MNRASQPDSVESNDIHLNDLFWTLQGEGRHSGRRMLFVRFPFCNYNCSWCDTDFKDYTNWSKDGFTEFIQKETSRWAVLTGGEPLIHKHLSRVISILKDFNFKIACETNGSAPIPEGIDFPTVSPKAFTQGQYPPFYIHPEATLKAKEFKYVVDQDFDFNILKRHKVPTKGITYSLSPEYSCMKSIISEKILPYIEKNPHWVLSLQTHKWIDIP